MLTEKQRRFVEAYLGGNTATESARIAGYSGDEAALAVVGSQNLRKPKIAEAIAERTKNDPLIADRDEIQHFWSAIMRNQDLDTKHRLTAARDLARSQALFIDKVKHEGAPGATVTIQLPHNGRDD